MKKKPKIRVERNKDGWYALRLPDGTWVGDDDGVLCYEHKAIAKVANTLLHTMTKRKLLAKIEVFVKDNPHKVGPMDEIVMTGEEAFKRIEGKRF